MLFIYRRHTFQASIHSPKPYRKPIALNWRYQFLGERYGDDFFVTPEYQFPRAINWRWRVQS